MDHEAYSSRKQKNSSITSSPKTPVIVVATPASSESKKIKTSAILKHRPAPYHLKEQASDYSIVDFLLRKWLCQEAKDTSLITPISLRHKAREIALFNSVTLQEDFDDWLDEWRLRHDVALEDEGAEDSDDSEKRLIAALESGDGDAIADIDAPASDSSSSDLEEIDETEQFEEPTEPAWVRSVVKAPPTLTEAINAIGVLKNFLESKKEVNGLEILKELEKKVWKLG